MSELTEQIDDNLEVEFTSTQEEYDIFRIVEEVAARWELVVVRSRPDVLQLDLDTIEDWRVFQSIFYMVRDKLEDLFVYLPHQYDLKGNISVWHLVTTSKSGTGKHVYIPMTRKLEPIERIALQACLGSDRKREALNMKRLMLNNEAGITLFETQEEYIKVVQFIKEVDNRAKENPDTEV